MEQYSRAVPEPPLSHRNAGHFRNYYLKNQALSNDKLMVNKEGEIRKYRHPTVSEITDFYLKRSKDFSSIKDLYEKPTKESKDKEEKELQNVNKELQRTYQKIMQKLLSQGTLMSSKSSESPSSNLIQTRHLRQTQSLGVNENVMSDPRKIQSQNVNRKLEPKLKRHQSEKIDMRGDNFKAISPVISKNVFADYRKSMHKNMIDISSNLSTMLQESCAGIDNICQKVRLCLLDASVSYQFNKAKLENRTLSLPAIDLATTYKKDLKTIFKMDTASEISVIVEEQTNEEQNENYAEAKKREIEKELDKEPHKETPQDKANGSRNIKSITPFFTILKTKSSRSLTKPHKFDEYLTSSIREIEKINEFDEFLNNMVEGINNEIENYYIECPGGPSNDQKKDKTNKKKCKKEENEATKNKKEKKHEEKEDEEQDNNDAQQSESRLQALQNEDHISENDLPANWGAQSGQRRHARVFEKTDFSVPDVYRKRALTNLHQRLVAQVEANDSFIFFQKLMKKSQQNSDGKRKSGPSKYDCQKTNVEKPAEKKPRSPIELLRKYENSLWFKPTKKTKKDNYNDLDAMRVATKNDKKWRKLLPQSYPVKSATSLSQKSSKSRKSGSKRENKSDIRSLISLSTKSSKASKGSFSNNSYCLQMINDKPLTEADRCRLSWMRIKYSQMTKKNLKYIDILDDITNKDLVPFNAEYPRRNEELHPKPNIKNSLLYKLTYDKNQHTENAWSLLLQSVKGDVNEEVEENDSQMTIDDVDENVYEEDRRYKSKGKVANVKQKELEKLCNNLIDSVQISSKTPIEKLEMEKAKGDVYKKLSAFVFKSHEGVLKQREKPKLVDCDKHKDKIATVICPEPNCKKCSEMIIDEVIYEEDGERAKTPTIPPTKQNSQANRNIAKKLSKFIFSSDEDIIKHQSQKVYTVMPAHVVYTNPPLLTMRKKSEPPLAMLPLQPMKEAKEMLKRGEWTDGVKKAPKSMKVIYDPASKGAAKSERLSAREITALSNTQMKIAEINSWSPKNFSYYCASPAPASAKPVLRKNSPSIVRKNSPSIVRKTNPSIQPPASVPPELFEIFKKASNAMAGLKKANPKSHRGVKWSQESTPKDGVSNGERFKRAPSPPSFMFDMDLIPKRDSKVDARAKRELEKLLQQDSRTRSKSPKEQKIWERKFGKTTGQKLISFVENQPEKYEMPTPKHAQPKNLTIPNFTLSKVAKQQEMVNQLRSLKSKNGNVQINIGKAISVIEDKMVDILSKPALTDSIEAFDEMEKEITSVLNSMKTKKSKKSSKHDVMKETVKEEEEDISDQLIKRLEQILDTSSMSSLKDAKQNYCDKFSRKTKSPATKRIKESKNKILGSASTSEEKIIGSVAISTKKQGKNKAEQMMALPVKDTTLSLGKSVSRTPKTPITGNEKSECDKNANEEDIPTEQNKLLPDKNHNVILLEQIQQMPKVYQALNAPPETIVNLAIIDRSSPQDLSPGGDQVSDRKSLEDEDKTSSNGVMGNQGDQVAGYKEGHWIRGDQDEKKKDMKDAIKEIEKEEKKEQEIQQAPIEPNQEANRSSESTYVTLSVGPTKSCTTVYCTPQLSPVTLNHGQNENLINEAEEVGPDEEIDQMCKIQQEINDCILNLEESMAIGQRVVGDNCDVNINKNKKESNPEKVITHCHKLETPEKLKGPQQSIKTIEDLPFVSVKEKTSKIQAIRTQSRKLFGELDEMTEESTPTFYDHVNKIISRVENVYSQLEEFEGELQSDFSESVQTISQEKSKNTLHPPANQKSTIAVFNQNRRDAELKNDVPVAPYMQALKDLKVVNQSRPETPKTPTTKCQRSPSFYNVLNFLDTLTDSRESYTAIKVPTVTKTAKLTDPFLLWTFGNVRKPTKSCLKKTPSQDQPIRIIDFTKDKERLDKIKRQQKNEGEKVEAIRVPKVSFHIMQEEKSTQVTICPYHSAHAMKILSKYQLELMLDKPPPKKDMQVTATLDTVEDKSVDAILEAHDDSTFENTDSILEKTDDAILNSVENKPSNRATNGSDTDDQMSNELQDFSQELSECSDPDQKQKPAKITENVHGEIKVFYDFYQDSSSVEKKNKNSVDGRITKVEGAYDEDTIDQVKRTLSKEKDLTLQKKTSLEKIRNKNIQNAIVSEVYKAAQLLEPLKNLSEFIDSKLLKEAIEARQKLRMLTRKSSTDLLKEIKRNKNTEMPSSKCSRATMTARQEGFVKGIYVFVYLIMFTALSMDYKCL